MIKTNNLNWLLLIVGLMSVAPANAGTKISISNESNQPILAMRAFYECADGLKALGSQIAMGPHRIITMMRPVRKDGCYAYIYFAVDKQQVNELNNLALNNNSTIVAKDQRFYIGDKRNREFHIAERNGRWEGYNRWEWQRFQQPNHWIE